MLDKISDLEEEYKLYNAKLFDIEEGLLKLTE